MLHCKQHNTCTGFGNKPIWSQISGQRKNMVYNQFALHHNQSPSIYQFTLYFIIIILTMKAFENNVEKEKNAGNQRLLPFPQIFPTLSIMNRVTFRFLFSFKDYGLSRLGFEPTTSRSLGGPSNH